MSIITRSLPRRTVLQWLGVGAAGLAAPRIALADIATDRRLVVVILRGAMDGLAAIPPYGDRQYAERRGGLALPHPGQPSGILALDSTFGLNPALAPLQPLWAARQLAVVPATFGGYRTRSHFDAQDMLETGLSEHRGVAVGWLNRALAEMPMPNGKRLGLALGPATPLTLRGPVPVAAWELPELRPVAPALIATLSQLYAGDSVLGPALAEGIKAQNLSDEVLGGEMAGGKGGYNMAAFKTLAEAAGRLLAAADGPRLAVLDVGGWDTHSGQGTVNGRLANNLTGLAVGLEQLHQSLGEAWSKTVVVCITEFGRTVAPNGTGGTDHGTASMTLLLGGAVRGGRITGDWPGLADLVENRDLKPATDIRAVLKGVLRDHLGLPAGALDQKVFPGSAAIRPLPGLVV